MDNDFWKNVMLTDDIMPTIKRVQTARYIVHEEKIYRLYVARVTWFDGSTQDFLSEEHAHAAIEDREVYFVPFKTA